MDSGRTGVDGGIDGHDHAIAEYPGAHRVDAPHIIAAIEFVGSPGQLMIKPLAVGIFPTQGIFERFAARVGVGNPTALIFEHGQQQARIDRIILGDQLQDLHPAEHFLVDLFFVADQIAILLVSEIGDIEIDRHRAGDQFRIGDDFETGAGHNRVGRGNYQ